MISPLFLWPALVHNNMHCWRLKENQKYEHYHNIGDLPIISFWYHSNDTKKNSWVKLCSHFSINGSSGYLNTTFTLQLRYNHVLGILQRVTKSQKVHISIYGIIRLSQGRSKVARVSSCGHYILKTTDLLFFKQ